VPPERVLQIEEGEEKHPVSQAGEEEAERVDVKERVDNIRERMKDWETEVSSDARFQSDVVVPPERVLQIEEGEEKHPVSQAFCQGICSTRQRSLPTVPGGPRRPSHRILALTNARETLLQIHGLLVESCTA
jgi:hypothetical protein